MNRRAVRRGCGRLAVLAVLVTGLSGAGGCANAGEGVLSGAGIGALGGLIAGSVFGEPGAGAAIGAAVGGATGAVIGDQNERADRRARRYGGQPPRGGYHDPGYERGRRGYETYETYEEYQRYEHRDGYGRRGASTYRVPATRTTTTYRVYGSSDCGVGYGWSSGVRWGYGGRHRGYDDRGCDRPRRSACGCGYSPCRCLPSTYTKYYKSHDHYKKHKKRAKKRHKKQRGCAYDAGHGPCGRACCR